METSLNKNVAAGKYTFYCKAFSCDINYMIHVFNFYFNITLQQV